MLLIIIDISVERDNFAAVKKLFLFSSVLFSVALGLNEMSLAQAPFSLPPRGYILPPPGGGGYAPRPEAAPPASAPRYPRAAAVPDEARPVVAKAKVKAKKAAPPVVAKAAPKKTAAVAKGSSAATKKAAVASNKQPAAAVAKAVPAATKPSGSELARELHPSAKRSLPKSDDAPAKAPKFDDDALIVIAKPIRKVSLNHPWAMPGAGKWMAKMTAQASRKAAPSVLDQPPSIAEVDAPTPLGPESSRIPLSDLSAEEPEISHPVVAEIPPVRVEPTSPKVAAPAAPTPVTVQPTLAAVRPVAFKPAAREGASDFTPGGAKFAEPPPLPPAKPIGNMSSGLGNLTINADRADTDNEKNIASFHGDVELSCERFQMKADHVVANLGDESTGGGLKKVVGEGNVTVRMFGADSPGYVGSGSRAVYDPIKETIILSGWPKIEEGTKALVANAASTEILIDTKTNHLTTSGSTKTLIRQ